MSSKVSNYKVLTCDDCPHVRYGKGYNHCTIIHILEKHTDNSLSYDQLEQQIDEHHWCPLNGQTTIYTWGNKKCLK